MVVQFPLRPAPVSVLHVSMRVEFDAGVGHAAGVASVRTCVSMDSTDSPANVVAGSVLSQRYGRRWRRLPCWSTIARSIEQMSVVAQCTMRSCISGDYTCMSSASSCPVTLTA